MAQALIGLMCQGLTVRQKARRLAHGLARPPRAATRNRRPGRVPCRMAGMDHPAIHLAFDGGTLVVTGPDPERLAALPYCRFDARTNVYRAEAIHYRALVEHLRREQIPYKDEARAYQPTPWPLRTSRDPFPHQTEALQTWWNAGGRGVVVLPTGTGKTFLAILAINKTGRPTLVVTPTIDLLNQWYGELAVAFDVPVGAVGGGNHEFQPLTVTTYDSAYIHLERWGNRFGLLVFDECHHLPGPTYLSAATGSIAPYRLGLTATPERSDGQEALLTSLIGPIVYRREIKELAGDFLAEYRAVRLYVELSPEEEERYTAGPRAVPAASWTSTASAWAARTAGSVSSRRPAGRRRAGRRSRRTASSGGCRWRRRPSWTCCKSCSTATAATAC